MSVVRRGNITESEKKIVAARQQWRCNDCCTLLPPSYQIDHILALVDGGKDSIENAQALCPTCHANKTQREHIARVKKSQDKSKATTYDNREDIFLNKSTVMCSLCRRTRSANSEHNICIAIEDPTYLKRVVHSKLTKFSYTPRF